MVALEECSLARQAAVCRLDLFSINKNIHRKTLRRISGVVILKSKCAVSEREIYVKIETNKRSAERAD